MVMLIDICFINFKATFFIFILFTILMSSLCLEHFVFNCNNSLMFTSIILMLGIACIVGQKQYSPNHFQIGVYLSDCLLQIEMQ